MALDTPAGFCEAELLAATERSAAAGVELLSQLVTIPSLSLPGSDRSILERSAKTVFKAFSDLWDWDFCEVVSADGGAPALLARKNPSPGRPTVLLYAHHDVQPEGDLSLWKSAPFEPVVREGRLYGRGSADDAAGIVLHARALGALAEVAGGAAGLGVVLCIEGEEESGSPTFSSLLARYREILESDLIVVADSDNPSPDVPALTTSLRGVVGVTVELSTLRQSVHSGLFGGPTPDALTSLIRMLAALLHPDGSVAVEGLDTGEVAAARLDEEVFRAEAGLLEGVGLWGRGSLAHRLWWAPALTVTGLDAPEVAKASNTLLARASAKVSLRIPPGMSTAHARECLETHLRNNADTGVQLSFRDWEEGEGYAQDPGHPTIELVRAALREGYGNPVVEQGIGGSIPFVAALHHAFPDVPIAIVGVEDRQSAAHGPNESVDLAMIDRAVRAEVLILARMLGAGA